MQHDGPNEVRYFGPEEFSPCDSAVYTPMNTVEAPEMDMPTTMAQVSDESAEKERRSSRAQTSAKPFYEEYAQTQDGETVARRCTTAMLRNWNTTDDYNTIKLGDGSNPHTDVNFPTSDAHFWADFNECEGGSLCNNNIDWIRISGSSWP
jgi:hypothetical protein